MSKLEFQGKMNEQLALVFLNQIASMGCTFGGLTFGQRRSYFLVHVKGLMKVSVDQDYTTIIQWDRNKRLEPRFYIPEERKEYWCILCTIPAEVNAIIITRGHQNLEAQNLIIKILIPKQKRQQLTYLVVLEQEYPQAQGLILKKIHVKGSSEIIFRYQEIVPKVAPELLNLLN